MAKPPSKRRKLELSPKEELARLTETESDAESISEEEGDLVSSIAFVWINVWLTSNNSLFRLFLPHLLWTMTDCTMLSCWSIGKMTFYGVIMRMRIWKGLGKCCGCTSSEWVRLPWRLLCIISEVAEEHKTVSFDIKAHCFPDFRLILIVVLGDCPWKAH